MADSIKKRICARIQSNLAALGPDESGPFKEVARRLDPMQPGKVYPSLFWYVGPEAEIGKDTQGRTYSFAIVLKLMFRGTDKIEQHDDLVAAVQDAIEGDLQLNGLANVVDGGAEEPFLDEAAGELGGSMISYVIQYRRVRGAADTTY